MYGYLGKDKAALYKWLASNLRKVWLNHPARIGKLEKSRFKALGTSKRGTVMMLWHWRCEHCLKATRKYEINHKKTVLSVKVFDRFCTNLFLVGEDDLEILCIPCHSTITYMERSGMSFEDAAIEKKVIKFRKLKAPAQKIKLMQAGISLKGVTNAKQRGDAVREYLQQREDSRLPQERSARKAPKIT
jgi:hypothetical protein